jgi:hypothetical protein
MMVVPDEVVDLGLQRPLVDNAAYSVAWLYTFSLFAEQSPD